MNQANRFGAVVTFTIIILAGGIALATAFGGLAGSEMKDMRFIEGGTFRMGDVLGEAVPLATPVHHVTLSGFYLNRYEVTVAEFAAFVQETGYVTSAERGAENAVHVNDKYAAMLASRGAHVIFGSSIPPSWNWHEDANWRNPYFKQDADHPVTAMSWNDAAAYCNWLSRKEGLPVAYDLGTGELLDAAGRPTVNVTSVMGYRLPTEAEWEYAARERGREIRFGNGKDVARSGEINFNAAAGEFPYFEKGRFRAGTTAVGSFAPNSLGLHDMSGNVWEWCSDFVGRYPEEPQINPYQEEGIKGPRRAARGGPWVGDASYARVSVRLGWVAIDRCNNIGFRLARSKVPGPE